MSNERFFFRDPDTGTDFYATEDEALAEARRVIDDYSENASADGWPDWIDDLTVGRVTHRSAKVNRRPDPDGHFDELFEVEMRAEVSSHALKVCDECRFFDNRGGGSGGCRRRSPARHGERGDAVWPFVYSKSWCGEWEPRAESQE